MKTEIKKRKAKDEIWIFVWWDLGFPGFQKGEADVDGRYFWTTKAAADRTFAHELGHALGLEKGPRQSDYICTPPYRMEDLMGYLQGEGGFRVHKNQGEIVNSKAWPAK